MIVGDRPYEILFDEDLKTLRVWRQTPYQSATPDQQSHDRESGDGRVKSAYSGIDRPRFG